LQLLGRTTEAALSLPGAAAFIQGPWEGSTGQRRSGQVQHQENKPDRPEDPDRPKRVRKVIMAAAGGLAGTYRLVKGLLGDEGPQEPVE
jgi:hypothetical protein